MMIIVRTMMPISMHVMMMINDDDGGGDDDDDGHEQFECKCPYFGPTFQN